MTEELNQENQTDCELLVSRTIDRLGRYHYHCYEKDSKTLDEISQILRDNPQYEEFLMRTKVRDKFQRNLIYNYVEQLMEMKAEFPFKRKEAA